MVEKIRQIKELLSSATASTPDEVEALRIKYLSKKGEISLLFNDFRTLSPEEKKAMGPAINELKDFATERINQLRVAVESVDVIDPSLDLTRTASPISLGSRHPLSIVRNEIISIFSRLGFTVAEGPEIEDD